MVGPAGNIKPAAERSPPPPGSKPQSMNATGMATGKADQTSPKLPSPGQQHTGVLNQTRRLSVCPAKMAVGGLAVAVTIGYFTLYSNKKPEATAIDVARVATGTGTPSNTRPRN
ncbi:unnamed protein product [Cuscuta epithymum]|uniref:Uncharacterized protein n=1 Tax=Cuscuta epithymum TaxID=186058 RepID=A0AAV0CW38_9ASTE|nr:unnamed protein product [Cuscuta epithymum]CAH9144533.1 unnamed protein product [Cuscuta epithymum]